MEDLSKSRDMELDSRERTGAYFTPPQWVKLSQQYLADEFGRNWQEKFYVWDCCAGTGNLLVGLTRQDRLFASTLEYEDVEIMHKRVETGELCLRNENIFQFDFLNDDFNELPDTLRNIIDSNPQNIIIYINPPYVEAANAKTMSGSGSHRKEVAVQTLAHKSYSSLLGKAGNEVFALFLMRIYNRIRGSKIANFSTLKILQGPNFRKFRQMFKAKFKRAFMVRSDTFDNVNSDMFPIGFFIWDSEGEDVFRIGDVDIYDDKASLIRTNTVASGDDKRYINDWVKETQERGGETVLGYMFATGNDFQHKNAVFIVNHKDQTADPRGAWITERNLTDIAVYYAVRHCIEHTWINHNDNFFEPEKAWENDKKFQDNCLIYLLFHNKNTIQSSKGINHWIPFTQNEVGAGGEFESSFMSMTLSKLKLSNEAQAVLDAGRELWKYYHQQPNAIVNASFYDIKKYFQGVKVLQSGKERMNTTSNDAHYTALLDILQEKLQALSEQIVPKVYEYKFLFR